MRRGGLLAAFALLSSKGCIKGGNPGCIVGGPDRVGGAARQRFRRRDGFRKTPRGGCRNRAQIITLVGTWVKPPGLGGIGRGESRSTERNRGRPDGA